MKVLYALTTEKAVGAMDKTNSLTFIVEDSANKLEIRKEIEETYGKKVRHVNTVRSMQGKKKAIVQFAEKGAANEVAGKLKLI